MYRIYFEADDDQYYEGDSFGYVGYFDGPSHKDSFDTYIAAWKQLLQCIGEYDPWDVASVEITKSKNGFQKAIVTFNDNNGKITYMIEEVSE